MTRQRGFTLIEWMITITIGLFITAGIFSIFSISQSESNNSLDNSGLLENGRVAMNLLSKDLRMSGFLGDFTGVIFDYGSTDTLSSKAAAFASSADCLDSQNVGSFPTTSNVFKSVWAVSASAKTSTELGCIDTSTQSLTLDTTSDIIDLKFANPAVACATETCSSLSADNFYIATNQNKIEWLQGDEAVPSTSSMANRRVFQYSHKVYFIATRNNQPGLYYTYLTTTFSGHTSELVQGIERMKILFAVDSSDTQDNIVDEYLPAASITNSQWNSKRVLGAKIYLLIRSATPDYQYTNTNSYQLGNSSAYTPNDHYRRLLLQSTINFNNISAQNN
jgi:type IV pilus assembly protein PilW